MNFRLIFMREDEIGSFAEAEKRNPKINCGDWFDRSIPQSLHSEVTTEKREPTCLSIINCVNAMTANHLCFNTLS